METDDNPEDDGADFLLTDTGDDVDLRLARLEALAGRRAALLSAVMLRQNPHNVAEWHKRVKLFAGDPTKQVGKLFVGLCGSCGVWFNGSCFCLSMHMGQVQEAARSFCFITL
jgi:hypothetical protein